MDAQPGQAASLEQPPDLGSQLDEHERAWRERPLLRLVYRDWYERIAARLARVEGETVELGAGLGTFREVVPHAVETDVEPTRFADRVADAESLPFADGSLANLVLLDVFHHLARPAAFLDEARRTLAPGGRVVLLEPYCSPLSQLAYSRLHQERLDRGARPFEEDRLTARSPFDANIALPTLVFFDHAAELARRWPELAVVERRLLTLFVYPLSGGFSRRPLLPATLFRPAQRLEDALRPLHRLAAFRCLVVLERR